MIKVKQVGTHIDFYWDNDKYLGHAYTEIDGFYVFAFNCTDGCWSDYSLRAIADKLTELNKPWADNIDNYFKNEKEAILKKRSES